MELMTRFCPFTLAETYFPFMDGTNMDVREILIWPLVAVNSAMSLGVEIWNNITNFNLLGGISNTS